MKIILDPLAPRFEVEATLYDGDRIIGHAMTHSFRKDEYQPCEDLKFTMVGKDATPSCLRVCDQEFHITGAPVLSKGEVFQIEWVVSTSIVKVDTDIRV